VNKVNLVKVCLIFLLSAILLLDAANLGKYFSY